MSILEEFRKESETICHLQNAGRLLSWDQQIVMPKKSLATEVRGRQRATLARIAHERLVSPSFGELLERTSDQLGENTGNTDGQALARWKRDRRRATSVSADLVEQLSLTGAEAFEAWRSAREASDFSLFEPLLSKMFELKREEASQIGFEEHPYDAMLDEFEPEMTHAQVEGLFSELRPQLVNGLALIQKSPVCERIRTGPLELSYELGQQESFARFLAESIGFPPENRIDEGTHPFCSAASSHDVRLVTRYREKEFGTAVFATLHEAGHGLYELHSPKDLEYTPLRGGASLGIHESQSRLWENLVGRSEGFWEWVFPELQKHFPEQTEKFGWKDYYLAANRVRPSFIRVEADEVTYSLHVILRFELEAALLAREIEAKDIPHLWNQKMKESLGVDVPEDSQGCLQDIHWSDGLIGYFPTYVLGNLIASDLWTQLESEIPNLDLGIRKGDFSPLLNCLITKIYQRASRQLPKELIQDVLGHGIQTEAFVTYLQQKYSNLYGVNWS